MPCRSQASRALILFTAVGFSLAGCSGSDRPAVEKVSGKITYRGQPVVGAQVNFIPQSGAQIARAVTDEDGWYRLGTYEPGDGVAPGSCGVSVTLRGADKPVPPEQANQMMGEDMEGTGDPLIPVRYFSPATSGLTAEVEPGGKNQFDFELTD